MSEIAENVKRVFERIEKSATAAGKRPEDITLIAAAKMNSADRVREAIAAGITDVGENRVQELLSKKDENAYEGARLHFIGTLQRNKVRNVVGTCELIQSVNSLRLMSDISKRAESRGIVQDILIEVNVGGEESKTGIEPEKLDELLHAAGGEKGINVKGLMTIPPISASALESRRYYDIIYKLFVDIRAKKYDNVIMRFLSMGMSGDYAEAILSGADMVRVGTAIFGARNY